MKENKKENYFVMQTKIKALGPIKEVVNNPDMIKAIIAYDGDRHYLCAFIDSVNAALKDGTITEEDLHYFQSGKFMDAIVHLNQTIAEVDPHELQTAERLDKVNYVSLLEDSKTLAVSYTHPEIIAALCGDLTWDENPDELVWWSKSGTFASLPSNVQMVILNELLKRGKADVARSLVSQATYGLEPYKEDSQLKR